MDAMAVKGKGRVPKKQDRVGCYNPLPYAGGRRGSRRGRPATGRGRLATHDVLEFTNRQRPARPPHHSRATGWLAKSS